MPYSYDVYMINSHASIQYYNTGNGAVYLLRWWRSPFVWLESNADSIIQEVNNGLKVKNLLKISY